MIPFNEALEAVSKIPKGNLPCGYTYEFPIKVSEIFWGEDLDKISSHPNVKICTQVEELDGFLAMHYIINSAANVAKTFSQIKSGQ